MARGATSPRRLGRNLETTINLRMVCQRATLGLGGNKYMSGVDRQISSEQQI